MKNQKLPIISFRLAVWIGGTILVADAAVITLVKDDWSRIVFSDLITPFANLLAVAALFYAARYSARNSPKFARTWYLWMFALLLYTIASIIWALYELVLGEPPFPSVADVFYISYYFFIWFGLWRYPLEENQRAERRLLLLDNVIVVLGAGLSFWIFLMKPFIDMDGFTMTTFLELAYPVLGMVSVWTLMIFFRFQITHSNSIPLLMIGFGFISEITADVLFAYQSLNSTFMSGNWGDLFFVGSSIAIMLAAIRYVASHSLEPAKLHLVNQAATSQSSSSRWPLYLPYFWLAVAYGILMHNFVVQDVELAHFLIIGLIIGLVIFRQVLTLKDNDRLNQDAQKELADRKQGQEELRLANLALDTKVEQRTNDLLVANDLLFNSNQKIERSLHEKEVLLKEIHHRVKNNLQIVSSLLNLQTHLVQDPLARSALQESQMRVRSMAMIHEKLYQSESLEDINLHPYIESLAAILFRSYQADPGTIQLITRVEDISVGIDSAVPIGLIVNELISNALKHAFLDGRSGKIQIEFWRESPEKIILKCEDNGRGLTGGLDISLSKSLGLQLVYSLTRQLEGEIEVKSQHGLMVWITIPHKMGLTEPENSKTEEIHS